MIIEALKVMFKIILGFAIGIAILYGLNWLMHTQIYSFFFEDMVKQTVAEMVDPGALKH